MRNLELMRAAINETKRKQKSETNLKNLKKIHNIFEKKLISNSDQSIDFKRKKRISTRNQ